MKVGDLVQMSKKGHKWDRHGYRVPNNMVGVVTHIDEPSLKTGWKHHYTVEWCSGRMTRPTRDEIKHFKEKK